MSKVRVMQEEKLRSLQVLQGHEEVWGKGCVEAKMHFEGLCGPQVLVVEVQIFDHVQIHVKEQNTWCMFIRAEL